MTGVMHAVADEWEQGWRDAFCLRFSHPTRVDLIRRDAWTWSAERLRGFLDSHEQWQLLAGCTCTSCPVHGHASAIGDAS